MNKQIITNALKGTRKALKKHSPVILTGVGIAGMITATVTAVKATPKALRLIDEQEIKENKRLTIPEVIKTTWKCYIPAAVTGTLSVACLIGASSVSLKRNAVLATAYTISETALKDYQEKAVEVVGEKKEQTIRDAVARDQLMKTPLGGREVVITSGGDSLCFDPLSGRYFMSDINKIKMAENNLNKEMRNVMQISLNEFYDEIGLSRIDEKLGDHLGWDIDCGRGYIQLDFSTQIAEDGRPCLVIGHKQPPTYLS